MLDIYLRFFNLCVCVCVCVVYTGMSYADVCAGVLACEWTCGGQMLSVFLCHCPSYLLSRGLSLNLELTVSAGLAGQKTLRIFLSPPQCWGYSAVNSQHHIGLFIWVLWI